MKSRKIRTTILLLLPVLLLAIVLGVITVTNFTHKLAPAAELTRLEQARRYIEEKECYQAVDLYKQIITEEPSNTEAILDLSQYYLSRSDFNSSQELLTAHINLNDSRIFTALASVYYQLGQNDIAYTNAKQAFALNPQDAQSISFLLKLANLNADKTELNNLVTSIDPTFPDKTIQLALILTRINLGQDANTDLQNLSSITSSPEQKLISVFSTYYSTLALPEQEFTAKANIVYALIINGYPEFAMPFAQDLLTENKYYENSYLYRAMIYISSNNFKSAQKDLISLDKYFPDRLNTMILKLQVALALNDQSSIVSLINSLINKFKANDSDEYFEVYKLLFKYHEYSLFNQLYLQRGSELTSFQTEIKFLAMKAAVYLANYNALPVLITYFNTRLAELNQQQRADFYALQSLQAFLDYDDDEAHQLSSQADTLYFYSPFVEYIKSKVFNDPSLLLKAYEHDLQNEIPKK